ncbi:4'-phosphopantetheinyl transferase family protein [Niveispirillum sp. KHB5.9]|uniref:4'-phosphopantetheinyl transferase family protein n=1 Tax=Niveispirillum sp. KHB5.9 TaxID=3400269 RepID=UPI003A865710
MRDGFAVRGDWRHDVIVVTLDVDGLGTRDLAPLSHTLDRTERERAARFQFDADRNSYIAAHGLTRLFLSAWTGRSAGSLAFNDGPYGKPVLVRGGASFNLSHSRSMVAVAVSAQGEVGVDIEPLVPARNVELDIADRWFSPEEVAQVGAEEDEDAKRARFMRIWNLKEAVIKATGRGLSQELTGFTVTPPKGDAGPVLALHEEWLRAAGDWRLSQWDVDGHVLAAASLNGPPGTLRHLRVTADGLAALADGAPILV